MTFVTSKSVPSWCRLLTTIAALISGASAQTPWVASGRVGSETRFLFGNQVQRYDVESRSWLPSRTLPRAGATAMVSDGTNAYVAYGSAIYRYNADFTGETLLATATSSVQSLFLDGDVLIAVHSASIYARLTSFHRLTGSQLSSKETYLKSLYGASHASGINRIYGRIQNTTPDIVSCSYTDAGILSETSGSPYFNNYPGAALTWVFPDETRVVDSAGIVYGAEGLAYAGSLAGTVTDIAFHGDEPVVLRGGEVIGFTKTLVEAARAPVGTDTGAEIQLDGTDVLVFSPGVATPTVQVVPFSSLKPLEPGPQLDPTSLDYVVDDAFQDENGNLLLFSKAATSLFRWSPGERRYTGSFPLVGSPKFAAYSTSGKAAYFAYDSGLVRRMDFTQAKPKETALFNLPTSPLGLATAGDLIFTNDNSGGVTHMLHSPDGVSIDSKDTNFDSLVWEWEPVKRRIYFFHDRSNPTYLRWESIGANGTITGTKVTPFIAGFVAKPPIRAKSDGSKVVIGSGEIFETNGMTQAGSLANSFTDAAWVGESLFSIRLTNGLTQIKSWQGDPMTAGPTVRQVSGTPVRIVSTPGGLLVVTSQKGAPRFFILNEALEIIHESLEKPVAPGNLSVTARDSQSVTLRWDDLSENEEGFLIDYRVRSGGWIAGASAGANATSATVAGLAPNTVHEFRVVARVATLASSPSPVVSASTTSSPDQPAGEPYLLAVTRIFNNRITIEWQDNATNETGFRILRSTTAAGTAVILNAPVNSRSFTDTGLSANTTYYYRVQAANGDILGDLSVQVSGRTLSSASVPAVSQSFTAVATAPTSVSLFWSDNSTNEDGFIIDRSGNPATTWTEIARVDFNVRSHIDTTAQPDTAYTYRVRAWNSVGNSANVTATVTTPKLGGEFAGHSIRVGDRYYFSFSSPNRIERYDLAARQWLAPVPLDAPATALWADEAGIYVAEDHGVVRFSPDGNSQTSLLDAEATVNGLFTLGDTLVFQVGNTHYSVNKVTGLFLASYTVDGINFGTNFVTRDRKMYYRRSYGIGALEIGTDGRLVKSSQSFNTYIPSNTRLFLFPGSNRIAGDSGWVFDGGTLAPINSLGPSLTDLSFHGDDNPVALRGNQLTAYNSAVLEIGSITLPTVGLRVAVDRDDALVFSPDGKDPRGLGVRIVPLSSLTAPQPGEPVNPRGLAFTPDDAFVDRDGNLLLFSKTWKSLFRWSPATTSYLPTVPLLGSPSFAAYSPENHSAYFAYDNQILRKVDLSAASPLETSLTNLPTPPRGMTSAGGFLYLVTTGNNIYSPGGTLLWNSGISSSSGNHNTWDPAKRRVYHFNDGSSSISVLWDAIGADGKFTGSGQTNFNNFPISKPIRVSPDGSQVVIGSGVVLKADGMTQLASLANSFTDAAWHGGRLVTARLSNGATQIQTWNGSLFTIGTDTRQVNGTPVRLLPLDDNRLLLVTLVDGLLRFTIFNTALEPVYESPAKPLPPSALAVTRKTESSVSLAWNDGSDNEDGFTVEYRVGTDAWQAGANVPAGTTAATITGLRAGVSHEFRVVSTLADMRSNPSATVVGLTLNGPDQPAGEPYGLKVTRIFHDRVTLEWQDNAKNETGFRILRSTSAAGPTTTLMADADSTSFTVTGLSASTAFYFRVQVVNGSLEGDLSAQVSATTLPDNIAPAAPGRPVIAENAADHVNLTWQDNSGNEESFAVERSPSSGTPWTTVGTVGFNRTSFVDATVSPNAAYNYRIRAVNAAGSAVSSTTAVTTAKLGGEFAGLSIRAGDRYYLAFTGPNRIERYDLANRQWLAPVPLNASATALWADEAGIYVAEDRAVVRFTVDGGNRTPMGNGNTTVRSLFTNGKALIFSSGQSVFTSLDKTSGLFIAFFNGGYYGNGGISAAPSLNRVFYRTTEITPPKIGYLEFGADGKLAEHFESLFFNDYPSGTRTFAFPDSTRVADDSGIVYSTESLTYANSFGGSFTDLSFHGADTPIVLRGIKLQSYTNTLQEIGSHTLATAGLRVAADSGDALVFIADGTVDRGLRVQTVPLDQFTPIPAPGPPVDARGLTFTPDDMFVDRDGNLLLFSKARKSLFRWSPAARNYLPTVPLLGSPSFAAYSPENHVAYFAYDSLILRKLDLSATTPAEVPLVNLSLTPRGMTSAGGFPFVATDSRHLYTYSPDGALLQATDQESYSGNHNIWDPVKRRVYHFRDGFTPGGLHWRTIGPDGRITNTGEFPYEIDFKATKPIRVSPDGSRVVLGSGAVFDAEGVSKIATLANTFTDAAWKGSELLTIRTSGSQTQLQRWNGTTFTPQGSSPLFPGTPLRLMAMGDGTFALITLDRGMPHIQLLGADLAVTYDYVPDAPRVTGTPPAAVEDTLFSWQPELWQATGSGTLTLTAPVLPSWLTLSNGVLHGIPAEGDSGDQVERSKTHRIVLEVRDGAGRSERREFSVTVAWRNDAPALPAFDPVRANDRGEPTNTSFGPLAIDPDGRDAHRWNLLGNSQPGLFSSVSFSENGRLALAYTPYVDGIARLTLQVTDASGATAVREVDVILPKLPAPRVEIHPTITLNRATGLYDQTVIVTNIAARAIFGFDLEISGLGSQVKLYNGASSSDGGGTYQHRGVIAAGEQVRLVLSYHALIRGKVQQPRVTPAVAYPPGFPLQGEGLHPSTTTGPASFSINRLSLLTDGSVKLSFAAEPGVTYRVQSSNDLSRWDNVSDPLTTGTGDAIEWVETNRPIKDNKPARSRFYRIERVSP